MDKEEIMMAKISVDAIKELTDAMGIGEIIIVIGGKEFNAIKHLGKVINELVMEVNIDVSEKRVA